METVLSGVNISVGYQHTVIIPPLDIEIPRGRVTAIIGPNGCGKSTLLKALARMLPLKQGHVVLDGKAISGQSPTEIARKLAILPQGPQAPGGLTVKELVAYGRYPHQRGFGKLSEFDKKIIDWAMSITDITEFAHRSIDALSGGQRQRAWIAMSLAQDTETILLDEPTTYLDMIHQLEILQLLQKLNREQNKTIALVIHDLNLAARFADWMIAMREGKVICKGSPEQIMTAAVLKEVFHMDACIGKDPWTGKPMCLTYNNLKSNVEPG